MTGTAGPVLTAELDGAVARFGPRPALVTAGGTTWSYTVLGHVVGEVAAGLARRGLQPGDVLAHVLPAGPAPIVLLLAAARLGITVAGVNPRQPPAVQTAVLAALRPDVTIVDAEVAGDVPGVRWTVTSSDDVAQVLGELRDGATVPRAVPADPDRPVALVLTSGTTGPPRAAVFTDRQLEAIRRADVGDRRDGGGTLLASTELVHVGAVTKLAWQLRTGTTLVLLRRWRADAALRAAAEHRMRTLGGVSAQVALLLRSPLLDELDLSHLQALIVGGGPSPPALVQAARDRLGVAYSIRYSSTESGGVGTGTAFDAPEEEALHTVGRPRAGVEVAVRDDDGAVLPPGQIGRVWLRSPTVMAAYWNDADATARALVDGWLRTDDLGALDPSGCLRLAGRADDVFVRGGYNVHPDAVERALASAPGVSEVAVVAVDDPVMGARGVAVVVPRPGGPLPTLEHLRAHGRTWLAHHELPERLVVVDELPRTPMDKLDRRSLRAVVRGQPET